MDKRLPKEITENKWIRLALKLIPFVPFLSVLWVKTSLDNDTYWIIKTGEYICKNGIPTKGEVLSFWAEGKTGYNANVRFVDSDRNERVIDMFMKNKPTVGDKVNIVYCIKPNGKIVSDIIEF